MPANLCDSKNFKALNFILCFYSPGTSFNFGFLTDLSHTLPNSNSKQSTAVSLLSTQMNDTYLIINIIFSVFISVMPSKSAFTLKNGTKPKESVSKDTPSQSLH